MRDKNWHGLTNWQAARYRDGKHCEICGSTKRLAVDHNHKTKAIRGVLCAACNMLVGVVENTKKLKAIIRYIKRHAKRAAKTAADFEQYQRPRGPAPAHGTVARYNYRFGKCRCAACRKAVRDRDRRVNDRAPRPADWGNPKHGTYAKYQQERKQGLTPCAKCRDANRQRTNERNHDKAREIKAELKAILKTTKR